MSEQQLINYYYWLKDRGQAFVFPNLSPSFPEEQRDRVAIALAFVSPDALSAAELEMVSRIGGALGLSAQDFRIGSREDLANFEPRIAVLLGHAEGHFPKATLIPISHPRDMLREPQLKVRAWESLKGLKGTF